MASVFDSLSTAMRKLLQESGIERPTPPQERAIPAIQTGRNILLVSPTGSGKTEAAMIPLLDFIVKGELNKFAGVKVIYVTPLRALNRDLLSRLENWCKKLDIKISVRHGDTSLQERRVQSLSPPDVIITTPETLQVLLVSRRMREYFSSVRWVVVDEIHELASDKRGSQLAVCLERLSRIAERDFQRIGLSATVGSPEIIARFLSGPNRDCEIIEVKLQKPFEFEVLYPAADEADAADALRLQTFPEVVSRLKIIDSMLREGATIIFTNTRSEAEILSSRLKLWNPSLKLGVHHGSLSRSARSKAESSLKFGELEVIVSTSSLEMGIDIGRVNLIVQYGSPRQVTRLVQRAGRSGHTLERTSRCVMVTQDSDDALEAGVISKFALQERIEKVEPFENPYDVLIQQIAGLLIERRSWKVEDMLDLLRSSYPFRNLKIQQLEESLNFMQSMRPRLATFNNGIVSRSYDFAPLFNYYFSNLTMIPETRQYPVINADSEVVGMLDEEFVAKEGEIGKKFILGGQAWRIEQVYDGKVYVRKEEDPTGAVPSWVGEEIPVPYEVAMEVGRLRRIASQLINISDREAVEKIAAEYSMDRLSFMHALTEINEQLTSGLALPDDTRITVETWGNMVIIHTHWGLRINRTLARILAKVLSEDRRIVSSEDAYRVVIEGKGLSSEEVCRVLKALPSTDLEMTLRSACEESGFFKIRFMHVARKMGIIERDADLTGPLLQKVMALYKNTVPFEEAWKTFNHVDVDLRGLSSCLAAIANNRVQVVDLGRLEKPSPLAAIALEEMSRKGEVIDPSRLKRLILEGAKVRAFGTPFLAICTKCWKYAETLYLSEVDSLKCPECGSYRVASVQQEEEEVERLARRIASGGDAPAGSKRLLDQLERSSELNEKFGRNAIIAQFFRIPLKEVEHILSRHYLADDSFYQALIDAERRENLRRFLR
ncbi:MAG: DEAD/DEAH box helicase [Conexivisphaerales archaeon]